MLIVSPRDANLLHDAFDTHGLREIELCRGVMSQRRVAV
jgi:hypothetical protein